MNATAPRPDLLIRVSNSASHHDSIRISLVTVNGTVVNHGTNATVSSGQVAIQAEGVEVAFRTLTLTPLE